MAKWWQNRVLLRKLWREIEPIICLACNFLGVFTTTLLPSTFVTALFPAAFVSVTTITPLAALVLAFIVYDTRSANRWNAAQRASFSKKIIRAICDGMLWPRTFSSSY